MAEASLPPHDRYAFKVAIICALPLEAGMVQAVFDKSWHNQSYRKALGDPNAYSLGMIGRHNVVLAHMPGMGNNNAATVAASMRSSFPGIEIAVVVGICGAVPHQDIVLGDCIISTQVVQYDFGKQYPHGFIEKDTIQDSLGRAPAHIRSFTSMLTTPLNQESLTKRLAQHLEILQKRIDLHYPGWQRDRLFQPSYPHQHHDGTSCDSCLDNTKICSKDCDAIKCEDDKLVTRKRHEAQPRIHFGRFGSANTVMKSGLDRDRIAAKDDLIAFEMEGSGVWDVFPTMIVKSACDYADSHKSKEWQQYAAATAASSLKAILERYEVADSIEHEKYKIPFSLQGLPVTKDFIARPTEMELLRSLLPERSGRRKIFVLRGLGGIGKTQMALEFMRTHHSCFSAVFWLDGSSEDNLKRGLASYSGNIMPGRALTQGDLDVVVKEVLRWLALANNNSWLLVFDNVDRDFDPHKPDTKSYDIQQYFPSADHGSILITTRLARLEQLGESQEVRKVDNSTAHAILKSWYKRPYSKNWLDVMANLVNAVLDEDDGKQLLELLDGLPLAIAQAGAYIQESGTSIKTYLRFYKETQQDIESMLDSQISVQGYPDRSVWTTWNISYEAILNQNEKVARLLIFWSFLDRNDLWYGIFARAAAYDEKVEDELWEWLGEIAIREESFLRAMHILRRYSLIESTPGGDGYAMHAVVHKWAYSYQGLKHREDLGVLALTVVGLAVPVADKRDDIMLQLRLMPHAQTCASRTLEKEAVYSWNSGLRTGWPTQREWSLDSSSGLAMLFYEQGKLNEAEKMYLRALQGYEEVFGDKHISTLKVINNLGVVYKKQGKLDEAEKMYMRALESNEKVFGTKHPMTLSVVNNLGLLFLQQGRLDEAEEMLLKALQGREEVFGSKHESVLQTLSNLGNLFIEQDKLYEEEKLLLRALQGYQEAFGDRHLSTLVVVDMIGSLRAHQGKFDEAEKMWRRALQGEEEALGVERLQTYIPRLETMWRLGLLYSRIPSKISECRELWTKALSGYTKILGASSPKCLIIQHQLTTLDAAVRPENMSADLSIDPTDIKLVNQDGLHRREGKFKGLMRRLRILSIA